MEVYVLDKQEVEAQANCKNIHLLKVIYITPVAPPYGGLANQTRLLASSSPFEKMKFTIVRSNPKRVVEIPGALSRLISIWPFKMYKNISNAVREVKPDMIFIRANGDISFLRNVFLGYIAAKKSNVPLVIHMHASRRGFWHNRKAGSTDDPGFLKKFLDSFGYNLVNELLQKATAFSQLTSDIDEYYQSVGLMGATHIIPNAVALNNPKISNRKANRFLFVGRLSREKGFFDLLEAVSLLKDANWKLDVLGSPTNSTDKTKIDNIIKEHPYKNNITLHGTIKGDDKFDFFNASSFLVLPTHLEVFPNVILEAMAAQQAVITTPIGEIENMLSKGGGIFCEPGNCKALSNAILLLLSNPQKTKEMGGLNRKKVSEYELDTVADQFINMLQGVISDKGKIK